MGAPPCEAPPLAENLATRSGFLPSTRASGRSSGARCVNEARRSADFLWALARPGGASSRRRAIAGEEHIDDALARGRGSPRVHPRRRLGGRDRAPAGGRPVPTTAIVTDDWLAWAVEGLRVRAGPRDHVRLGARVEGGACSGDGEAILVLGDYAKDGMRTYPVRLLDAVAELPAGLVTLARLCGTPLVPFSVLPRAHGAGGSRSSRRSAAPRATRARRERALLQELADRWTRRSAPTRSTGPPCIR